MRIPDSVRRLAQRLWPHHRALLAGLWVLVQLVFLRKFHGPHSANDSSRYLAYAANIAECGYFEPGHNLRYVLYPLFQSLWLWLGLGWWGIVAGQMAISALATRAIYRGTRRLAHGGSGAAALATLLYIGWPDIQQFNVFLLTESLFISLVALSFGAFTRIQRGRPRDWAMLVLVLTLTALARPNGFMVPLAAALAGLDALRRAPNRRPWRAALLGLVLLAPLLWAALNHQLATYYLMDTYQRGELIFRYQLWAVHQAAPLQMPPNGTGPVARVVYFAIHNPVYLGRLMLGKLFVFISYLKPHYSLRTGPWGCWCCGQLIGWRRAARGGPLSGGRRGCFWRPCFCCKPPLSCSRLMTGTCGFWPRYCQWYLCWPRWNCNDFGRRGRDAYLRLYLVLPPNLAFQPAHACKPPV